MAALPSPITVAQFWEIAVNPAERYELHNGEVVIMTRPNHRHVRVQYQVAELLRSRFSNARVYIEFPYRPLEEFEMRVADVAIVEMNRDNAVDPDDHLHGSPELVVEVKSPSNTLAKLYQLAGLCVSHGAHEFWLIDPDSRTVTVFSPDRVPKTYEIGDEIKLGGILPAAGDPGRIRVKDIFESA
jgi:Uma2 family endonuclease